MVGYCSVIVSTPAFRLSEYRGPYRKVSPAEMADVSQPTVVTLVSTTPTGSAGVVATRLVPELLTMVPSTPPKETAVAFCRFVPVIVTEVPPATGPVGGLTLMMVGVPGA